MTEGSRPSPKSAMKASTEGSTERKGALKGAPKEREHRSEGGGGRLKKKKKRKINIWSKIQTCLFQKWIRSFGILHISLRTGVEMAV